MQWNEILETADRLYDDLGQTEDHFHRMVQRSAIPLTIGQLTGLSGGQVSARLAMAGRVRRHTPNTWAAFRYVQISHGDSGMSLLEAYLPSFVLAAVEQRVEARINEIRHLGDPEECRTKDQVRADIVSEWLLARDHAPANLTFDVAVTIPVTALTGDPVVSSDGQWGIPAGWALDEFMLSSTFWHRMLVDPVTNDVLAHDYVGRFAPDVVSRAIQFRDRVCQAPGCCKPAGRCDLDHRSPWPDGPTSGDNLWPLCRRHHAMKGHRVLRWMLPDGRTVPVESSDFSLAS